MVVVVEEDRANHGKATLRKCQSLSVVITYARSRWSVITVEASVGIRQWRLGTTGIRSSPAFRRNVWKAFTPYAIGFGHGSFVLHKISPSNISRTVWPRFIQFYADIHSDLLYSNTGYNITDYCQLEVIAKNSSIQPPTASSGISWEWFKQASQNYNTYRGQ